FRNRRDFRKILEIVFGRDCCERELESEVGEDARAIEGFVKSAGAANRIVRFRPRAVDGDLKFHSLAIERLQELSNAAGEERRVGQHDQLAAVRLGDVFRQSEDVAAEEWRAAGVVDAYPPASR